MRIESSTVIPPVEAKDRVSSNKTPPAQITADSASFRYGTELVDDESSLKMKRETDDDRNTVYRLVDNSTGEVLRQLPSQQVLNVEDSIQQLLQQEMQKPKLDVKS
jgi:hypothetical protein